MPSPDIPLSRTKVIVPKRRGEILTRPRLLDLLDKLLDSKRLILISAPAGYGKTSLLVDYASHAEMPLCWLSLDALDQDLQRFIAYFIAAIAQAFPKFGRQSKAALGSVASLEDDAERLLVTLVNEIFEQVPEHFLLVLDDYQFVNDAPAIRAFVNRFAQLVGENCHLTLSSRKIVALPDAILMIARDQVGGLGPLELAFTAPEIQALFAQNYHQNITPEEAEELVQQTEGWITGLQLSNRAMAENIADRLRAARAAGVGLFDYLSREVLDQQPPALREFLLRTALMDEFDASLCEAVLAPLTPGQPQNWKELVAAVQQNNLFVLPMGPAGQWLRYHHLFQEFLEARLREERSDLVAPILLRLAQVHEQNNDPEKSYAVYQRLGDVGALASLVERTGRTLLYNDRLITLSTWLENLPATVAQTRPVLLSLQGAVAVMQGKAQDGLALLDQAEVSLRSAGDAANWALTLIRRSSAYIYLGNYAASLADAEAALRLKGEGPESIRAEAERAKGLSLHRMGKVEAAIESLSQSLEAFTKLRRTRNIPRIQMELGVACRAAGNCDAALQYYQKALSLWKKESNLSWQSNLLNNMGVLYHFQGEYEQAVKSLEEGLACARRSGYARMEALNLASLGDVYADLDELDAAQQAYQLAHSIASHSDDSFLNRYLTLKEAGLARARGEYSLAASLLDLIRVPITGGTSNYEKGLFHLEKGRILLARGNSSEAVDDFRASGQHFSQGGLPIEASWSQLWLAAAHNHLGAKEKALECLYSALGGTGARQPAPSLVTAARQAHAWLEDLGDDALIGDRLRSLLGQAAQVDAALPAILRRLRRTTSTVRLSVPRLTIQAFGSAQVKVNAKRVTISQWQTQEARRLFFYFLTSARTATKEQVGLDFWPDLSPSQLKLRFKNTIYRLRRALGQEAISFNDNLYQFNRTIDYEYDVETFEMCIAQAKAAQDANERIAGYQSAVVLVRGLYLEDIDATWAEAERERLKQEYLSALVSLARLHQEGGDTTKALQACQRALAFDPCCEEAYCQAMRLYAQMGDRAAVARQYRVYQQAFASELGLPPSPETKALYRSLIA
jgi:ATP/maltotriose-dependent transcriptional regulator MalT/two-component SAPR family response regulator